MYFLIKYLVTAGLILVISEAAKLSVKLGGLIAALPLVTVFTLIWLNYEQQPIAKISNHAYYTFWYVIPTLPMFLLMPYFLTRYNFWLSLFLSLAISIGIFGVYAMVLKTFGIDLI
ncbi:DUF3147 family protein [Methylotenera sp. N17]|uniref:DUF3147 family protein n=1 Tax=Methylotenera sp. N17 TaxID=1502761 RepID=UPI000645FA3C|nr:DUF3147 family protein [Methylotenera sp. N17]